MKKINITYKEYINSLNKNKLIEILDIYHIEYKKNQKKEVYENIILDNLNNIVNYTIGLFQNDEFINIKYIIKKKGYVKVKYNHLLLHFLNNLESKYLLKRISDNEFVMPNEILNYYKLKIKNKSTNSTIKKNTEEYSLILGFVNTYGVVEFDFFYQEYSKIYKLKKDEAIERLNKLSTFYHEFNFFSDKKKDYLASIIIKDLKECKKYIKLPGEYKKYTNNELIDIYNFKYISKFRTYKKLYKFIDKNYNVSKGSFKVINKYVLMPYIINYECGNEKSLEILSELIDKYFEFNNDKYKEKFIKLVENLAKDYPSWRLKGLRGE